MRNKNLIESFKNAVNGLFLLLENETNMRIHLCIGIFVLFMARFMNITKVEYILVVFAVFLVLMAEGINTAIEHAVNVSAKEYDENAKKSKDTASAVPLIAAVLSVITAFLILYKPARIKEVFLIIIKSPIYILLILIYLVISAVFIFSGRKKKRQRRNSKGDLK